VNALIFGANGQDGYYLKNLCQAQGIISIGISRSGDFIHGDVSDCGQVEQLIKKYKPKYVFHLAAKSTTRHDAMFENHGTICTGTLNILESVYRHCPNSKLGLDWRKYVIQTDNFQPEYKRLVSNPTLIQSLDWQPRISLQELAANMIHN